MSTRVVSRFIGVIGLAMLASAASAQGERRPQGPAQEPTPEAIADRVFSRADADADGVITKAEAEGQPIERVFAEIDIDSDGSITRLEVTTWLEKRAEAQRHGHVNSFEDGMSMAGRSWRGLRRSPLDETSRKSDLQAISMIEAGLVGAKIHIDEVEMAPQAQEKYGDDHAAFEVALRLALLAAIDDAVALEKAITEGDAEGAKAARDTLAEAMRTSHDAFQPQDEDDDRPQRGPGRGQRPAGRDRPER